MRAVICVNGGKRAEAPGTWSASVEWLVRRLAPRFPELGFLEVRYRVKSWRRLELCVEDALEGISRAEALGARTLALLGFSMGGAVATRVAAHPAVTTVIGLAPWLPERLDLSPLEGRRVVLLHGSLDGALPGLPGVSPTLSLEASRRLVARGVDVTHALIAGAPHAIALRAPWGAVVPLPRAGRWAELVAAELERFAGPAGPQGSDRPQRIRSEPVGYGASMTTLTDSRSIGLEEHGIRTSGQVHWRPTTSLLYTHALASGEARLAEGGPLVVDTGRRTGRSPRDKFVVREPGSVERIWWSDTNATMAEEHFEGLREKVVAYLEDRDLYVVDAFAGADPAHRLAVRVVTDSAWHALFAKTLFIDPSEEESREDEPQALVLHAPALEADPAEDGTRSSTFVVLHPTRAEILIGGTEYAGEIKKSIFTLMNDRLPLQGALPMHCSANVGDDGKVAVFFGLSGTGKTTLSADPERHLIGDDEHGWADTGVFNLEGGCYAKVIKLSAEAEPQIYATTRSFGTVLENVVVDEHGVLDLDDDAKTENTRAAYKLEQIANALPEKRAGHPSSVVFLTADAFGILPPIARLTRERALFYFLSGFTAKLAGTEIGVREPQPTFSPCFGAPFLPQPPSVYARMLGEKLDAHDATVWLVNTGWTGGPYGEGERMPIAATRALLHAALSGELGRVGYRTDPVFGFEVPVEVPGVESRLLDPRSTWREPERYDRKARELARMFRDNFQRFEQVDQRVAAAGPVV